MRDRDNQTFYLAGPMTGIPQFNFPAFLEAAKELRRAGLKVICPAELDDKETRECAMNSIDGAPGSGTAKGETWGDFLARDLKLIADSDINAIVVLDGWMDSKGARMEVFAALNLGYPVYEYMKKLYGGGLMYLNRGEILDEMRSAVL